MLNSTNPILSMLKPSVYMRSTAQGQVVVICLNLPSSLGLLQVNFDRVNRILRIKVGTKPKTALLSTLDALEFAPIVVHAFIATVDVNSKNKDLKVSVDLAEPVMLMGYDNTRLYQQLLKTNSSWNNVDILRPAAMTQVSVPTKGGDMEDEMDDTLMARHDLEKIGFRIDDGVDPDFIAYLKPVKMFHPYVFIQEVGAIAYVGVSIQTSIDIGVNPLELEDLGSNVLRFCTNSPISQRDMSASTKLNFFLYAFRIAPKQKLASISARFLVELYTPEDSETVFVSLPFGKTNKKEPSTFKKIAAVSLPVSQDIAYMPYTAVSAHMLQE